MIYNAPTVIIILCYIIIISVAVALPFFNKNDVLSKFDANVDGNKNGRGDVWYAWL